MCVKGFFVKNITIFFSILLVFSCMSTNNVEETKYYESPYTNIQYTTFRERLNLRTFDEGIEKLIKLTADYSLTLDGDVYDDILDLASDIEEDWDDLVSCYRSNPDLKIELEYRRPFMDHIKELAKKDHEREDAFWRALSDSIRGTQRINVRIIE